MSDVAVFDGPVIGLNLGARKTGVCALDAEGRVDALTTTATAQLLTLMDVLEEESGVPARVVGDVPLAEEPPVTYRGFELAFQQGKFSNNQVGLQPKDPGVGLPKLGQIRWWLRNHGLAWGNEFPAGIGVSRETDPGLALGLLIDPDVLMTHRHALRFRYGRDKYLPPVVVIFDLLARGDVETPFFAPALGDAALSWAWLEEASNTSFAQKANAQAHELLSALACALLGHYEQAGQATIIRDKTGPYLLPPMEHIHSAWKQELGWILKGAGYAGVEHPFKDTSAS
jgi:hypothetical protein